MGCFYFDRSLTAPDFLLHMALPKLVFMKALSNHCLEGYLNPILKSVKWFLQTGLFLKGLSGGPFFFLWKFFLFFFLLLLFQIISR